jgi:sulfur relay (sulfurtransferase) DsrC/TusE family protein
MPRRSRDLSAHDNRPCKKQRQKSLPILPENIVSHILYDYIPPRWNIGLTNKENYSRIQSEVVYLKDETRQLVKYVLSTVREKYREREFSTKNDMLVKAVDARMKILKNINRLSQLCPKGLKHNGWLPVTQLTGTMQSLGYFKEKWIHYIKDYLSAHNVRRRTDSFMQAYETYSILRPVFLFCEQRFWLQNIDFDLVAKIYADYNHDYYYNYTAYCVLNVSTEHLLQVIRIVGTVHEMILAMKDYDRDSSYYEYDDITLEELIETIESVLRIRAKLDDEVCRSSLQIDMVKKYVHDMLYIEIYHVHQDWTEIEFVHDLLEFYDNDDLIVYSEVETERKKLESWYTLHSILTGFVIDKPFIRKIKQLSRPGHLLHYIN